MRTMKWSFFDVPKCEVLWEDRLLTFDGWNGQFSWNPQYDQRVRRWLEETHVTGEGDREARERLMATLPSFLEEIRSEDAMMDFLRGAYHQDPASTMLGRGGGPSGLDRDLDPFMRTQRVAERQGTSVDPEEIDDVVVGLKQVFARMYRGLLRMFRGGGA